MILRQTTPLRYPGGKQRLSPFIAEVLECNGLVGGHYAEPYAGGAGVATDLLLNEVVSHIHLNDSSRCIFAFWHSVLTDAESLCRRVSTASLSVEDWQRHREVVRHPADHDLLELGFSTFYLNRCNRSGVLTAGVIGGLSQTGRWRIDARFPRNELIRRIEAIAAVRERVTATNLNAEEFMSDYAAAHLPSETFVYCDPPYYERAQRLYLDSYEKDDHARLARFIQGELGWKWAVSYDAHQDIVALYQGRRQFTYDLQYSATRVCKGREVFIFADEVALPQRSTVTTVDRALSAVPS
jgi:DNA adenine methylase